MTSSDSATSRRPARVGRRRRHGLAALVLALVPALVAPAAAEAETEFRIATIAPAGTSFVKSLRAAGETISERTDGRVDLKLFPGGVMGSSQAVLRRMRVGQLQGALVTGGGLAQVHPYAEAYSMPFLFRSYAEVEFVRERIDPVIREHIEQAGYILAGISEGGFTYLFSQDPLPDIEAMREARIWTPEHDEISPRMFERAGIRTVSLPVADVYTALQTGMVDAAAINPSGAIALQWHTGVDYRTDVPLTFLTGMLILDERTFRGLDAGDQAVVRGVLRATFDELDELIRADNQEAMEALRAQGIEDVPPSRPAGERGWREIADATVAELVAADRYDDGLLQRIRDLLADYRANGDD